MKRKFTIFFRQFAVPFFILGLVAIVFLMLAENKSISNLARLNSDFQQRLQKQDGVLELKDEIALLDSKLQDLLKSGESEQSAAIRTKSGMTKNKLKALNFSNENEADQRDVNPLIVLLTEKTDLQNNILEAYSNNQAVLAGRLMNSQKNKALQDSTASVVSRLMQSQKEMRSKMAETVGATVGTANLTNMALIITASIFCFLVWYSMRTRKKQSEESEKKAINAVKIKENFLANMSHEIRTPLNAVLGFTNILTRTKLDEQQKNHLQIIQSSGNSLLAIVNDILDLSKIEAGMMRIEEAPFRIVDVLATVEQMLSPKANEKDIKLIIKIDEDVPETLSGDAVRLTQVLVNLVSNAIKFTQEGGVYVKVTPFKSQGDSICIEFLVRDTGVGIPKEKQMYIFERFEQAEAETTRRFGGTGLGLSIVKHLIELQKGKITLSSQEGAGSIFLVELPYKLTNQDPRSITPNNQVKNIHPMNSNINILVAEDNIMNQHLIKYLLKSWKFKFDLVFNGVQAIEAIKKQNYDLVLMDIQMPEMDGHMATRNIRNGLRSTVPVIAMTAHAMEGECEKCINSGMNDYISKPLDEEKLLAMIIQYTTPKDGHHAPVAADHSVISMEYIDKLCESDDERIFKDKIIREFVIRVPDNIQTMEKAINEQNYSTIHRVAHDMKTTIHYMGLTLLIGHLLQKISELASSQSGMNSIQLLFGEIKPVCIQAVHEASRLVA